MPNSLNLPVRKKEEKCRRKEGKSQCRRGVPKPRSIPAVVSIPNRSPSPATTPVTPPPVVAPPVATVPLPLTVNLLKDPNALIPTGPAREGKAIRRKAKDKVEKDVPKTTIRKKKNSATATQSISIDGRTSSENDGPIGSKNERKKKNSQTSSNSAEAKSDGSKEPSENDDKNGPKINPELAKNFFKHLMESKRARARKRSDDARLETMPESSQINSSARIFRNRKKGKKTTDTNFFKPNGEPVWVVPERVDGEEMDTVDGVKIANPELAAAMAEEGVELDEKPWDEHMNDFIGCVMRRGPGLPESYKFNVYAPEETLEVNNEYITPETVLYNTCKNINNLSSNAMQLFAAKQGRTDERRTRTQDTTTTETTTVSLAPTITPSQELYQLKTCVMSMVTFNLKSINYRYDRRHPIGSIQKLRKKLNNTCSMEQTCQPESK